MHEPQFSQLAVFVTGPGAIELYREYAFPSVPIRTGLLPVAIEDIQVTDLENLPMAVDIALTRAAVVVYDEGRRSRISLDYVRILRRRGGSTPTSVIVVTAPDRAVISDSTASEETPDAESKFLRPRAITDWSAFVEQLLSQMSAATPEPNLQTVDAQLKALAERESWPDLLLTSLALLERQLRMSVTATVAPDGTERQVMQRLQNHFESDFTVIAEAMDLRHALVQNLPQGARLKECAAEVADIVRQRYAAHDPAKP